MFHGLFLLVMRHYEAVSGFLSCAKMLFELQTNRRAFIEENYVNLTVQDCNSCFSVYFSERCWKRLYLFYCGACWNWCYRLFLKIIFFIRRCFSLIPSGLISFHSICCCFCYRWFVLCDF